MSTRPSFYFMCGIIVKDEKAKKKLFDPKVREKFLTANDIDWIGDAATPVIEDGGFDLVTQALLEHVPETLMHEVFREGNPAGNYGPYVAGYVIDFINNEMAYALMILFEEAFGNKEFIILPQLEKEKHTSRYFHHAHQFPGKEATDLAITEGRWINYYDAWYTDNWFKIALALLHFAGWTETTREMLKIALVKEWC